MFRKMTLHNFKAFEHLAVDLAPLTIFLGPNNSGKSSILAALRLLGQTVESPDLDVPLLLSGVFGDFGTFRDVVYKNHRGRPFSIALELVAPLHSALDEQRVRPHKISFEAHYKFRTQRRELILRESRLFVDDQHMISTEYSDDSERQLLQMIGGAEVPSSLKGVMSRFLRMDHFIPEVYRLRRLGSGEDSQTAAFLTPERQEILTRASTAGWAVRRTMQKLDYLGPMRVPPARTYQFSGEKRRKIGLHGENAAGILAMDWARRGKKKQSLLERVSAWLSSAGIADSLEVEVLSDRHYEIRLRHVVTGEKQNLADVGYGSSQVVPVLAGGYSLQPGDIFMVEEPEIHLHPRAQSTLGDFFVELVADGVQSIIETHSEHLVLRLQQHVAARNLSPKDVAFYYVFAPTGTGKVASHLSLDEKGVFVDSWPEGFFPERLEEAKRLARIRQGQLDIPFRL